MTMKYFFFSAVMGCLVLVTSCTPPLIQMQQHWKAYKQAMKHGDLTTAIVEVNAIYSIDTTDQAPLDTMMRLYFIKGNHLSAYSVGSRIEKKGTVHKSILGESAYQLGKLDEAKAYFLDVEASDSAGLNLASKYKLATLHFGAEEYVETLAILNKIVSDERSLEQYTRIGGDNSVSQNVPLYAASHNFAGFVFMETGDYESARSHFDEALSIQPDFRLAQNNLLLLEEKIKAG